MSKLVLPGLIDPHVHLRDPGQTQKEDFYTGTKAALAGGYTTVIDMPNNKVPITTFKLLEEKIAIAKAKIVCDVGFYFGSLGDNLDEFEKVTHPRHPERSLAEGGRVEGSLVLGLKLYLNQTTGNFLIEKERIEAIFKHWTGGPILLHAEDEAVSFVINVVRKTGKRAHFCHISTQHDLALISRAKENNLPITCGVTPHHLFLTEHDEKTLGPFGKMKPPLRPQKDVDFLWKNLQVIDVVESDHAPHTIEEKESDSPPYGVPGLETTLPLLLTAASENRLTIDDIIRLFHTNPARIFGIQTDPTTKIEVDLNTKYEIRNTNLQTKCAWSPFNGWKVKGKVQRVWIRDTKVFEDGKILVAPGFGLLRLGRGGS